MKNRILSVLAVMAILVACLVGLQVSNAATSPNAAVAVTKCVKPTAPTTSTINNRQLMEYNKQSLDYIQCRFDELQPTTPAPTPTPTPSETPTPTPSPTPTNPVGEYPDADNTGPSGNLTAYNGPMTITTNGTVIDSKVVTGALVIRAANVVVKNSRINGSIATDENSTGFSFTLSDSFVNAGQALITAVGAANFKVFRTEVVGGNRSINCWKNCEVRDSYVHGQATDNVGTTHESGVRMGANNTIVHNSIVCDAPNTASGAGCSANLTGYGDFAPVENVLVENNYFPSSEGGFCAYGGSSRGKPYSSNANNIRFIDNVFARDRVNDHGQPDCAWYGAVADFDVTRPGNVFRNNRYTDGVAVTPGY